MCEPVQVDRAYLESSKGDTSPLKLDIQWLKKLSQGFSNIDYMPNRVYMLVIYIKNDNLRLVANNISAQEDNLFPQS